MQTILTVLLAVLCWAAIGWLNLAFQLFLMAISFTFIFGEKSIQNFEKNMGEDYYSELFDEKEHVESTIDFIVNTILIYAMLGPFTFLVYLIIPIFVVVSIIKYLYKTLRHGVSYTYKKYNNIEV